MIKVDRLPKPKILESNEVIWREAYLKARKELEADPGNKVKKKAHEAAEGKYNHPEIKARLKIMFNGDKCAYCESHIRHVSYPHIEHFRPKQFFPELCFEWENLLLACGVCNSAAHKGTKFPEVADGGPFVNPANEEPDEFFEFVIDPATRIAFVRPKNRRGEVTEEDLGLNRSDLIKHRSPAVMNIFRLAAAASKGDEDCRSDLILNCHPSSEYAAFARSIADRFRIDWKSQI